MHDCSVVLLKVSFNFNGTNDFPSPSGWYNVSQISSSLSSTETGDVAKDTPDLKLRRSVAFKRQVFLVPLGKLSGNFSAQSHFGLKHVRQVIFLNDIRNSCTVSHPWLTTDHHNCNCLRQ